MSFFSEISIRETEEIISGCIIGSGIFITPVYVFDYTRKVAISLLIWVVAGAISLLGNNETFVVKLKVQELSLILSWPPEFPLMVVIMLTSTMLDGPPRRSALCWLHVYSHTRVVLPFKLSPSETI